MPLAVLTDRAILEIAGADARDYLDRLVTSDVSRIPPGEAGYAALLTPQGKIIADFIIFAPRPDREDEEPRFRLDVARASAADLAKRLNLYKLRAKVRVGEGEPATAVLAGWGEAAMPHGADIVAAAPDPRLPALGWRAVVAGSAGSGEGEGYQAHRIGLGVPEGGRDFAFGDAFPHEALMDQLGGVDFAKGCYVGQEVVSRMQHRGTARTRIVPLAYASGSAAAPGTEVFAGDRALGRTGTGAGPRGLATLRLDRAAEALAAGDAPTVGGVPVRLEKPDWVRFPYPGDGVTSAA